MVIRLRLQIKRVYQPQMNNVEAPKRRALGDNSVVCTCMNSAGIYCKHSSEPLSEVKRPASNVATKTRLHRVSWRKIAKQPMASKL